MRNSPGCVKAVKSKDIQGTISIMAAMKKKKSNQNSTGTIALNKKARHDYHLQEKFEAGVSLQGWELKSIREGKVNITGRIHHFTKC